MNEFKSRCISVVSIWTDKIEETMDFYANLLGLERCNCSSYHMEPPHFRINDAFLVILNGKTKPTNDSQFFPIIAITVDELEKAYNKLKSSNIEILKEIEEDSSSRWFFCKDPGGNLIELAVWK